MAQQQQQKRRTLDQAPAARPRGVDAERLAVMEDLDLTEQLGRERIRSEGMPRPFDPDTDDVPF